MEEQESLGVISTTIMSYNIQHGVGMDGQLNLQRIAAVILDSGVGIVGLQEVDRFFSERSDYKDQAKEIASLTGYHYVYGANLDFGQVGGLAENSQYGNAIVSKYPILRSDNILLSSFGEEQRGMLHAVVDLDGIHVNIYNTHLGLDARSRLAQAEEIIDLVSRSNQPSILMGDFNAEPDSPAFQRMLESGLFVNSFQDMEDVYTFPSTSPTEQIDYILISPGIKHQNQHVVQTEASDHLPIVVDLVFK